MNLNYFLGGDSLSEFRSQDLLGRMRAAISGVDLDADLDGIQLCSISCRFVYVASSTAALEPEQVQRVATLLAGDAISGAVIPVDPDNGKQLFDALALAPGELAAGERGPLLTQLRYVAPRQGTLSPWSSKATDIVQQCGVGSLHRIERARVLALHFTAPAGGSFNTVTASGELDVLDVESRSFVLERLCQVAMAVAHDRMVEEIYPLLTGLGALFETQQPKPLTRIRLGTDPAAAIAQANEEMGLALTTDEVDYLSTAYTELQRDPTDTELMMFAQANSEHCRHKIFNASWTVDGVNKSTSLFGMIKNTHAENPDAVLSAYSDNAAVMRGNEAERLYAGSNAECAYSYRLEPVHYLLKVETHNHPTAISPHPGASTGAGGEIRDEGATGLGARPKAGMTGFSVGSLRIPGFDRPWETDFGKPERIVSALDIMLEGPIGGAAFNNEFGRPNLCGYFRTLEMPTPGEHSSVKEVSSEATFSWGYHKPIMIAGGIGNIRDDHVHKPNLDVGAKLVVLGGPAMLIGLGGGAASSVASGQSSAALDFASVQRDNPEMERRCQEVIDRCWQLGADNPIAFIHDVGAGGLSNALPELVKDGGVGGVFSLRAIPSDEPGMSPLEIWCNESQERYVLAVAPEDLPSFEAICRRERAPFAVVGVAGDEKAIVLKDDHFGDRPVDLPMPVLFGKTPKTHRDCTTLQVQARPLDTAQVSLAEAIDRVLTLPAVASKSFLITIGDRTVTGLIARDQMIGPWQVPVADAAICCNSYVGVTGEAMAVGERTPIAVLNAKASARMAIGEAITNLCSAWFGSLRNVVLSANWMAAAGQPGQDAGLYAAVEAVGMELCPKLGIAIPVGKDSLSMSTAWQSGEKEKRVTSPVSLIATAAVATRDIRLSRTPELADEASALILVDLGDGKDRLGGSALGQVLGEFGEETPDVDSADHLSAFVEIVQALLKQGRVLAYHDRSDGGVFVTLAEMAFASRLGLTIDAPENRDLFRWLFTEELGAVLQIRDNDLESVIEMFAEAGLQANQVATLNDTSSLSILESGEVAFEAPLRELHARWHETSYRLQSMRDNPETSAQEYEAIRDASDAGLHVNLPATLSAPHVAVNHQARVAILREQGVNSQNEMAAAFKAAGFEAFDVHMSDLLAGRYRLSEFQGLAACGGFSFGDVLGAGEGWAKSILYNDLLRDQFSEFFADSNHFTLGVCNGCQMLASLAALIPGTQNWPQFKRNDSEQFEARLVMAEVQPSATPWFEGMNNLRLPIVVSHGEGRAEFEHSTASELAQADQIALRYCDGNGDVAHRYPQNPNGSPDGLAGIVNAAGNVLIMMPHPERVFRASQFSWYPRNMADQLEAIGQLRDRYDEYSPWHDLFRNAAHFVI